MALKRKSPEDYIAMEHAALASEAAQLAERCAKLDAEVKRLKTAEKKSAAAGGGSFGCLCCGAPLALLSLIITAHAPGALAVLNGR